MHIEEFPWAAPHELFHAFADEAFALFLDSATAAPGRDPALHGHWSFIALDPFETMVWRESDGGSPFALLRERMTTRKAPAHPNLPPFTGGAAGFFGYDLGRTLEHPRVTPRAVDDQHLPVMALGFYDTVLAFDHAEHRAWLVAPSSERANALRKRLTPATAPVPHRVRAAAMLRANFTRDAYERAVAKVVDYIYAGDIFQANISQRFETRLADGDTPYDLYLRLREASPAPFASFFNFGEGAIVSSSPERFLLTRNGEVETKPIKGTRPRGTTLEEDAKLAADLLSSEKDRAENVMIVDLLRNDISRVCEDGSVTVEKLCALESFAQVHHLVSTVRGRLRQGETHVDLLAACFPGGSITGAPKLRAMEIIAELEPTTRGPYCGAIGYLGFNGAMDTSIAIRTMVTKGDRITFQAGGGITADSDPATEYEETLTKARGMARALGLEIAGAPEEVGA
ncbi:aminodeoxychorismate synthase component I [Parvibaculum sedimenti]|uniref:aminodeoxychorismate synthase n=1 Tax=Parvibaculum sedimenti TaxID=2608632 RepID=A0A6N6VNX3_9HYPH|nr:aminodeoxychorismate synthase component I [Parvibaculum sedimenti]KAB7742352.1 aminodeoxychorismate synthase component I [Parvibaculum sedimenti]